MIPFVPPHGRTSVYEGNVGSKQQTWHVHVQTCDVCIMFKWKTIVSYMHCKCDVKNDSHDSSHKIISVTSDSVYLHK